MYFLVHEARRVGNAQGGAVYRHQKIPRYWKWRNTLRSSL